MENKIYQYVSVTTLGRGSTGSRTEIALFSTMVKHESVEKSSLRSDLSYLMAV